MGKAADSFRKRVAAALLEHGTIAEICRKTGYSRNAVKTWANEHANPRLDAIEEIADALGLQPWELLRPEGAKSSVEFREHDLAECARRIAEAATKVAQDCDQKKKSSDNVGPGAQSVREKTHK